MTAPAPLAFPGSRTLAGWWRQLTPSRPRGLWVGHLLLHRVEALVGLSRTRRPDSFDLLILQGLALLPGETAARLDEELHLGVRVLNRVLDGLKIEGLAQAEPGGCWTLTPLGRQALAQGEYPWTVHERRSFTFVERGQAGRPPHFLNLNTQAVVPWSAPEGWAFDPSLLEACIQQSGEWKQRYGFPAEVQEIVVPAAPAAAAVPNTGPARTPQPWQRVILDRPERLLSLLVLVQADDGGERLNGHAVRQDGWQLQSEPVFTLSAGWRELFPELAEEPAPDLWRQAWRQWCQPRGLVTAETDTCPLERSGHRLRVIVSGRLLEKLRSSRSDALKGEAWLLAGEGRFRTAAQLEITEARQGATPAPG